jgi:hypothetical protein
MLFNFFFHLIKYKVAVELELPQSLKIVDAGEGLHFLERPNYLIDLRGRSTFKIDIGDVSAVENKYVEIWELIFVEGETAFVIRLVRKC